MISFKSQKYTLTLLAIVASLATPATVIAQDEQPTQTDQESSSIGRKLGVRFVALGHRRLAEFTRSQKARVIRIKTPDGGVIEETIPAGVPIEVMGKEFEYLPPLIYIPERKAVENGRIATSPLILNACTQEQELSYRPRLDILLRRSSPEGDNEMELKKYASAQIGEEQTSVLVTLINRYNEKEGWKKPLVRSFDTSPEQLPGGSLLVFNGTPFEMEVEMPIGTKFQTFSIKPLESKSFKPNTNSKKRTVVKARLVSKNGQKKQFFYNSLVLDSERRAYLFSYFDPRRKAVNPAGMVQFQDEIKMPEPSNKGSQASN